MLYYDIGSILLRCCCIQIAASDITKHVVLSLVTRYQFRYSKPWCVCVCVYRVHLSCTTADIVNNNALELAFAPLCLFTMSLHELHPLNI